MEEDKLILYNSDGTPFHGIYLTTFSFTDNIMAETFLSGSFKYDGTLLDSEFDKTQYTIYKQNKYYIFDAPTVSMKYDDGLVKYDVKFIPEKDLLKNIPFTDEVTEGTENRYFTSGRDVKFFGDIQEFVGRLNAVLLKNAPAEGNNTQWTAELQADIKTEVFEINLSNVFVTDALKTMYETYNVPYYIENRKILIGKPNFKVSKVFEYGQNKGLCGLTKTPKNNKVVTRITGHGGENNIPFRYPVIKRNNGEVIEHSYTRPYLMPSIYVDLVNKKVNPDVVGYNPNISIIDYYDAIGEDYVTQINNEFPIFQIQDFEIQPTIQNMKYPLNEDGSDTPGTKFIDTLSGVGFDKDDNNNIDPETGDVEHPFFTIQLHPMGFDLYGCAIETGEMTFAMKSGACAGCEFKAAIDYELWKENFYVKEGDKFIFRPGTPENPAPQRNIKMFPYTNYKSIQIKVYKDLETFGTLLPIQPFIVPKEGDKFVILHIDLPQEYIDEAQDKLDQSLKQFMKENNFDKYSFSSDFDEKFLIENQSILDQFKTNSLIDIRYNDKIIELSVIQLSISYDENKPLPSFKFTLSDEIEIRYNVIQEVANDLEQTDFIVQQNQIKGAKDAANFYKGLKTVEKGLFDADGNNRIGTVESLVLKSNALFVGNDSSNFAIQNGREHLNINGDQGQLNFDAGTVIHFSVSRSEEYDITFASWNVDSLSKTGLVANIMYYVYVVANRTNESAQFKITTDQIIWNSDPNVYHFLWGQLVQTDTDRTAYKTYGMSALMGGAFTGQLLRSPNYSYAKKQGMEIDLLNATIRSYVTIEGQINVVGGSKGANNFTEWEEVTDAQLAAKNAEIAASNAQKSANNANDKLTNWSSDSIISPPEKTGLRQQQSDIKSEYVEISSQADRYILKGTSSWTEYNQYYGLADAALTKYSASTPAEITIASDYSNIAAYYSKRQVILNSIAIGAKKIADDAATSAGQANDKANGLVYLKKAFGEGVVAGDVVLGGFVGVSNIPNPIDNPNAKIVAGMAGYVPAGQTEFPMLFAGAANANAANDAIFRVYAESGKTICKNIIAEGGTIGGLKIIGNALINDKFDDNAFISFRDDKNKKLAAFGVNVTTEGSSISGSTCILLKNIKGIYDIHNASNGIVIDVSGNTYNYAIKILNGDITLGDNSRILKTKENMITIVGAGTDIPVIENQIIYNIRPMANSAYYNIKLPLIAKIKEEIPFIIRCEVAPNYSNVRVRLVANDASFYKSNGQEITIGNYHEIEEGSSFKLIKLGGIIQQITL